METCQEFMNSFSAYLDHELPIQQELEIEKHLEYCEPCKRNFAEMKEAWKMLDEYQVGAVYDQDSTIRKFYSQTLPALLIQYRFHPFSFWLYAKSILAGAFCGMMLYWMVKCWDTIPQQPLRQNFPIFSHPDFAMISNLDILENYEVFEHFSAEKLQLWKSKN